MAITPLNIFPVFIGTLAGSGILGVSYPQMALALTNSFVTYANIVAVTTVDVGTLGVGVGNGGGVFLSNTVLSASLVSSFASATIVGPSSPQLIAAISEGVSLSLLQANIVTSNPSVGVGGGSVSILPNPLLSIPAFITGFLSAALLGSQSIKLATAIAEGLDQAILSATGAVIITPIGSTSNSPSSGFGIGKLE